MKKLILAVIILITVSSCTFYCEDPSMKSSENIEILSAVDSTKVVYVVKREAEVYLVSDGRVTHELQEETYFPVIFTFFLLLIAFFSGVGAARD